MVVVWSCCLWLLFVVVVCGCCLWLLFVVVVCGCCLWLLFVVVVCGCCLWLLFVVVVCGKWLLFVVVVCGEWLLFVAVVCRRAREVDCSWERQKLIILFFLHIKPRQTFQTKLRAQLRCSPSETQTINTTRPKRFETDRSQWPVKRSA